MRRSGPSGLFIILTVVSAALFLGPLVNITHSQSTTWNSYQRFTSTLDSDFGPFVLQAHDGTVWVFWEFVPFATPWLQQIRYRTTFNPQSTFNASRWTPDQILVSNSAQNVVPRAAQLPNGTIFLSYSSNRTGNFDIFLKKYNTGQGWSPDSQVTNNKADEVVTSLVAAKDGTLWLFWDRQNSTASNIFYKYYRGVTWSAEFQLTFDKGTTQDSMPSAYQLSDGRIFAAWSQQKGSFTNLQVLYSIYNGVSWSSPIPHQSAFPDRLSAVTQDSNDTIWLMWTREFQIVGGTNGVFDDDIAYTTSMDGGNTWSNDTLLTNDLGCTPNVNCYDDFQPSLAQLKDSSVYAFFVSNRDPQSYQNIFYATSSPIEAHTISGTGLGSSMARPL
jgi:Neuraminidase (sialidase)